MNKQITCEFTGEFIQLNQMLKKENIAMSGGEAKTFIENGFVSVNGQKEFQIRKKLRDGDIVNIAVPQSAEIEVRIVEV